MVRVQDSEASWEEDKTSILNHITQTDDPLGQPPMEHEAYDALNSTVRGLFRGAALYTYAMEGNTGKLRELLSEGAEKIDYQTPDGSTPALRAAVNGQVDCLRLLAENKANLDLPDEDGYTPATAAAQEGQVDCLRILAEHKADLDLPKKDGATPAFVSAQEGQTGCLRVLIDAAADVNTAMTVASCHSPLTIAALQGQLRVYELLLASGADTAYKALPKHDEPYKTAGGTAEQILQERASKTE